MASLVPSRVYIWMWRVFFTFGLWSIAHTDSHWWPLICGQFLGILTVWRKPGNSDKKRTRIYIWRRHCDSQCGRRPSSEGGLVVAWYPTRNPWKPSSGRHPWSAWHVLNGCLASACRLSLGSSFAVALSVPSMVRASLLLIHDGRPYVGIRTAVRRSTMWNVGGLMVSDHDSTKW
jgi:hypothetical protein